MASLDTSRHQIPTRRRDGEAHRSIVASSAYACGGCPAPLCKPRPLELIHMAEKVHLIACRLSEEDFTSYIEHAHELDLSQSDYLRRLIRIPVTGDGLATGESCISLDTWTFGRIYSELVRWGRHYNQAVRAMNTIALHVRKGHHDQEFFEKQIAIANEHLEATETGRADILKQLERLETMTLVG